MGFDRHQFTRQTRNVIVEDICSFYYLSSLCKMYGENPGITFLPSNGPAGVTTLVNLLIGWGFDFSVLLFDNPDNQEILSELYTQLEGFVPGDADSMIIVMDNIESPEDMFSTLDFKKHIIKKRIGIADSNSGFLRDNEISRPLLASEFARTAAAGVFSPASFDDETRDNLEGLFASVSQRFRISGETV